MGFLPLMRTQLIHYADRSCISLHYYLHQCLPVEFNFSDRYKNLSEAVALVEKQLKPEKSTRQASVKRCRHTPLRNECGVVPSNKPTRKKKVAGVEKPRSTVQPSLESVQDFPMQEQEIEIGHMHSSC